MGVALLVAIVCLVGYWSLVVWPYATLDAPPTIRRSHEAPDRLIFEFTPTSRGQLAFHCGTDGRGRRRVDEVQDSEAGQPRSFEWNAAAIESGGIIQITYRQGLLLRRYRTRVPEPERLPAPDDAVLGDQTDSLHDSRSRSTELYARRTRADRHQWIGGYGGTPASETAVANGLDWLARHQMEGGFWGPACVGSGSSSCCDRTAPCDSPGGAYEASQTGLALLAFQAGGHYDFNGAEYSDVVRRGLDWLVDHQRSEGGLIGTRTPRRPRQYHQYFMYEHGIATFALAEACALARASGRIPERRYLRALRRAVGFMEEMQHDDGGWRYRPDPKLPSDTSVTGWQVLAIKSALTAGVPVSEYCLSRIGPFFDSRAVKATGQTRYLAGSTSSEATTGVGMLARQFLLDEGDSRMVGRAADFLADLAERRWDKKSKQDRDRDFYLWYNCTLAMFHAGGEPWERWNGIVRDTVVGLQRHDGCSRGSWDPRSRWGHQGGRVYSTALAVLTLEVYYRYAIDDGNTTMSVNAAPDRSEGERGLTNRESDE